MKKVLLSSVIALCVFIMACKNSGGLMSSGDRTSYGYEFKILSKGTGTNTIKTGDVVDYTMYGYLNDTMKGQPYITQVELLPGDSIQRKNLPFVDMMYMLREGDSAQVIQKLDTIKSLPPQLKPTDVIKYVVKVRKVKDAATAKKEKEEAMAMSTGLTNNLKEMITKYNAKKLENIITTASGLKYVILEKGTGEVTKPGAQLSVHYIGMNSDGSEFDQSYKRGQPISFPVGTGGVIKGWDEVGTTLPKGTKLVAIIPSELGYGAAGSPPAIQPNATLFFYMDIQK